MGVAELIAEYERKDLLRFLTAGSVDDGKSTLIGRLLHDSKLVYEDHMAALERDSARKGSAGGQLDFSLLLDGLRAEREQGITIDVAYRYFATPRRKFIIADTPGHEQYTRNMATGASTADLAVILVDAQAGVLPQTRRHSFIATLLGIRHIVVAVNKMDLVGYSEDVFERIRGDYSGFAARLEVGDIHFIPISALTGANVVARGADMPWYGGAPLLEYLETVHVASDRNMIDMRLPVQYVVRPDERFRGYAGTVASGIIRKGDEVAALPSGLRSRVASISTFDGEPDEAFPPMAVAVTLEDDIDVGRGDVLVHPNNAPRVGRAFDAMVVWMADAPLAEGGAYLVKHCAQTVPATVSRVLYRVNVNTLRREDAKALSLNEIGRAHVALNRPVAFDPYSRNRATGRFVLIDRTTNATVGAGMILERGPADREPERAAGSEPASTNVRARRGLVTPEERAARLGQRPVTLWLTGLPRSGKSTVAYAVEKRLHDMGRHALVIDGENMRLGVSRDLGFAPEDRSENVRRAAGVARLANDTGLIVIAAFVSPYESDRANAREIVGEGRFREVHLSAPLEVCESRDADGLYAAAREGRLADFSGVTAPYEPPAKPDLALPTHEIAVDEAVDRVVAMLREGGFVD